jgi:hypothetical protein
MRSILSLPLLLCAASTLAQPVVVVPGSLANVEGNTSSTNPFGLGSSHFQQVISASEFGAFGAATARIDQIWFRLDGNASTNFLASYGVGISFSTTTRMPDGLDVNFANNVGIDFTRVYSAGGIPFQADYVPGALPQPFSLGFLFSTPFDYVPSRGNLLMDIQASAGILNPQPIDAQSVFGDWTSSVYDHTGAGTIGIADTGGLVIRFDVTLVPEPPPSAMFFFAVLTLAGFLRLRHISP